MAARLGRRSLVRPGWQRKSEGKGGKLVGRQVLGLWVKWERPSALYAMDVEENRAKLLFLDGSVKEILASIEAGPSRER